jgi:hypothetical protein
MAEKAEVRHTLSEQQARQLANVTKTVPMMEAITPRWLVTFLSWTPVEAGTYRVNKVKAHARAPERLSAVPMKRSICLRFMWTMKRSRASTR